MSKKKKVEEAPRLPRAMALQDAHRAWLRRMVLVVDPEYQLPPPITYPEDLHPLPDDIEAYCRYSFRSEDLVSQSPHLSSAQFRAMCDRHAAVLTERGITPANSRTDLTGHTHSPIPTADGSAVSDETLPTSPTC